VVGAASWRRPRECAVVRGRMRPMNQAILWGILMLVVVGVFIVAIGRN